MLLTLFLILGVILMVSTIYGIMKVGEKGNQLQAKFLSLGNMTGKTKDEIIATVGQPNAMSYMFDGKILLQWMADGYHISILFTSDGKFFGITQEISV